MNTIKFLSRLSANFNKKILDNLDHAASVTVGKYNLAFKIMEVSPLETTNILKIYVQTEQLRKLNGLALDSISLTRITREMFNKHDFKNTIIDVRVIPFIPSSIDLIDADWVSKKLKWNELTIKNIADDTGIDKTNLSAWANGSRPMSHPVKALMHYYFKSIDQQRYEFTPNEIQKLRNTILKLESEKVTSTKKMIRHKLRSEFGFYISEFKDPNLGFTTADFELLLHSGKIKVNGQ